jgi:hypothetical protein
LLNSWDREIIIRFIKDFFKAGRILSLISFEFNPVQMKFYNYFQQNPERLRKEHIEELKLLHESLANNDRQGV